MNNLNAFSPKNAERTLSDQQSQGQQMNDQYISTRISQQIQSDMLSPNIKITELQRLNMECQLQHTSEQYKPSCSSPNLCQKECHVFELNTDNSTKPLYSDRRMNNQNQGKLAPLYQQIKELKEQEKQKQHGIQRAIEIQMLTIENKELAQDAMFRYENLSSITLCRITQFFILTGNYIYYIIWLLYAVGSVKQQNQQIKIMETEGETGLITLTFILITIQYLCQVYSNGRILVTLKKRKIIEKRIIGVLKVSLLLCEVTAFMILMYYSWEINTDFKILAIVSFLLSVAVQFYYIRQYQELKCEMEKIQTNLNNLK